jgi:hypothetical protein
MLRIGARRDLRIEMAARQPPGHEPLRLELIEVPVAGEEIEQVDSHYTRSQSVTAPLA